MWLSGGKLTTLLTPLTYRNLQELGKGRVGMIVLFSVHYDVIFMWTHAAHSTGRYSRYRILLCLGTTNNSRLFTHGKLRWNQLWLHESVPLVALHRRTLIYLTRSPALTSGSSALRKVRCGPWLRCKDVQSKSLSELLSQPIDVTHLGDRQAWDNCGFFNFSDMKSRSSVHDW